MRETDRSLTAQAQAGGGQPQTWCETQTQQPQRLHELSAEKRRQAITRLWRRMSAIYGEQRWLAHAPENVQDDWADILRNRTPADLVRGLSRYEATPGQFPPGAAAFRESCREFPPGTFSGAGELPQAGPLLSLPQLAATSETGRQWLAFMWREGLAPRPRSATDEVIAQRLEGCDIDAMRSAVAKRKAS